MVLKVSVWVGLWLKREKEDPGKVSFGRVQKAEDHFSGRMVTAVHANGAVGPVGGGKGRWGLGTGAWPSPSC